MAQPTVSTEKVDPAKALDLLKNNKNNRKLTPSVVEKYSHAMKNGLWRFDGAPVRIGKGNVLLDGQHRLHAIVKSGTTQELLIVKGIDTEAQFTMDTGKKRTLSDALAMQGETFSIHAASLSTISYRWEQGIRGAALYGGGSVSAAATSTEIGTLLDHFKANREAIKAAVKVGEKVRKAVPTAPRTVMLASYLFTAIDVKDAEYFFERLSDGAGLSGNSPILMLRNKLIEVHNGKHQKRTLDHIALAYYIKAWNAFRVGNTLNQLKFSAGGAAPEKFPEPV